MKKAFLLLCLLAPLSGACRQPADSYRSDLKVLRSELPARHIDLFARIDRAEFERRIDAIASRADSLTDERFGIALMQLAAAVGDEHTVIGPAGMQSCTVPVQFEWFDEGIFVIRAAEEKLLLTRLTAVGGIPVGEALRRLRTLLPADNETLFRAQCPSLLNNTFILKGLDLADSTSGAVYTLTDADGSKTTVSLHPDPQARMATAPQFATLRAFQDRGNYVGRYLPEARALYFNYRRCAEEDEQPFAAFNARLFETIAREKPQRLIVDLRYNGGGNSMILQPFIDSLGKSCLKQKGRLYVLIGKRTFSSALLNALQLRQEFGAILIGEPTAGSVNHYGEVRTFTLPATGATVYYSTRYFRRSDGPGGALRPDIPLGRSFANFRDGRDEVLEYALTNN